MLVHNCNLEGVRDLFCKIASARGISPVAGRLALQAGLAWAAPCATARSPARCVAWAARVGRAGEFIFLFHKELEIVF